MYESEYELSDKNRKLPEFNVQIIYQFDFYEKNIVNFVPLCYYILVKLWVNIHLLFLIPRKTTLFPSLIIPDPVLSFVQCSVPCG